MAIVSTFLYIAGLLALSFTVRGVFPWTDYHLLIFFALAVGIFGMVFSAGTMGAYKILVYNDSHSNSVWFKLQRKIKSKIDRW